MEATDPIQQAAATKEAPEPSAEVLATFAEIGEEVNASLDLDEVLAHTAALIKRHIDYELFGVLMADEEGTYLKHRFAVGYPPGLAENLRVPIGQGITGTAAATGHPVRVSDVTQDPRYINAIDSVRSELAVPLMFRGKCVGVLDIPEPASGLLHEGSATHIVAAGEPAVGGGGKCAVVPGSAGAGGNAAGAE